jgi:hypothetical protein
MKPTKLDYRRQFGVAIADEGIVLITPSLETARSVAIERKGLLVRIMEVAQDSFVPLEDYESPKKC